MISKFEGSISNNKKKIKVPPPPSDASGKKIFFWISLIYMDILVFMFEGPISNNK